MIHFDTFIRTVSEKKFFYDRFSQDDVCGMFTLGHFLSIALFFLLGGIMLCFSRKLSPTGVKKAKLAVAIAVTIMEIAKISIRIYKNQWYDSWLPLYYCSLFIFAIWASVSPFRPLSRMGNAYITMGGVAAAVFFTFYPSTSLAIFPIWHPAAIHSFVYHLIMFYTGILILTKKDYVPDKRDSIGYFIFILAACLISLPLNLNLGTNCMFLNHAFKLPIMEPIINFSKPLYMLVVFLAQGSLMFWGNYLLYLYVPKLITKIKNKKRKETV